MCASRRPTQVERNAGIEIDGIAPSKTAGPSGDRARKDPKDAELLARLTMAAVHRSRRPVRFVETARLPVAHVQAGPGVKAG
jgi:hypothetical protein